MSSEAHYQSLYEKYIGALSRGDVRVDDTLSHLENDRRMGISLIIPMHHLGDRYGQFLKILATVEPDLYFYPLEDLHITVFDFIQGSESYRRDKATDALFSGIMDELAKALTQFTIEFRGVVFSDEAGMLQGFDGDYLVGVRQKIRTILTERGIRNDERYESRSAHITFCRFQKKMANTTALLQFLNEYRYFRFGNEAITHLELVEHDWYNLKRKRRIIQSVPLSGARIV